MSYRLSLKAQEDIIGIYLEGVEKYGVFQAEKYSEILISTFSLIAENPRLARQRFEFTPPVRIHPCRVHMIVYDIDDSGDVLIIRIRAGREDWSNSPID